MRGNLTRDHLNVFDTFGKDFLLLTNSNLLAGFEVAVDPSVFTEEDYLTVEQTLLPLFLRGRRYYFVFKRQPLPLLQLPSGDSLEVVRILRKSIAKHLKKRALFEERCFLFIEAPVGEDLSKETKGLRALTRSDAWVEREYLKRVKEFRFEVENAAGILRRVNPYGVRKMTGPEMASLIYSLFTFQPYGGKISGINLFQLFSAYDILVEDGFLRIGDTFASVVSLSSLPPETYSDFFEDARTLNIRYHMTQIITPVHKGKAIAFMGPVTNFVANLSRYSFLGPFAEKMKTIAAMNRAIMESIEKGEQPFEFSTYLVLYSHDKKQIREQRDFLVSRFLEYKAQFVPESLNLLSSFFASIPGHDIYNLRKKLIISSSVLDMVNLYSETTGDEKPIIIFQTEKNSLLKIDPFSPMQHAWNFFVTGSTGSGKSFFMNYYILNSLVYDPYMFIFDYGESYKTIVKFLNTAKVLKVNLESSDVKLNPFKVPAFDKKHLQYLVLLVEALISNTEDVDMERKVKVTQAIKEAFEAVGISEGNKIAPDQKVPTLSLVFEKLKAIDEALARRLSLWTKGAKGELYGEFFDNEEDNFSFQKIQYIEMTGFDEDPKLASVLTFVLFNKLFDTIQEKEGKKFVIMDEVWKFMLNSFMAARIEELFRTARKHGASIGIITQHPDDILRSPHAEGIFANTQVKYFLHQKEIKDEEKWKQHFKFNDRAMMAVKELKTVPGEYSEIFVWSDHIKKKVRLRVNPLLYWLFTTKEEERRMRDKFIERYGVREGLLRLLETVYGRREQNNA